MTHSSFPEQSLTSCPQVSEGMRAVVVVWRDAYAALDDESDYGAPNKFGTTVICWDIGFLVRETKTEIVLAVGACPDDNTVRCSNTIPRSMILDIVPLGQFKWALPPKSRRRRTKTTPSTAGSTKTYTPDTPNITLDSTTSAQTDPSL